MKKGLTLIELLLAMVIGMFIFQVLFSTNIIFNKLFDQTLTDNLQASSMAQKNIYFYKLFSNASSDFSNMYKGVNNPGYFYYREALGQPHIFYLYRQGAYSDFEQAKYPELKYTLMHLSQTLTADTYGQGDKVLANILSPLAPIISYQTGFISADLRQTRFSFDLQVRVKN